MECALYKKLNLFIYPKQRVFLYFLDVQTPEESVYN